MDPLISQRRRLRAILILAAVALADSLWLLLMHLRPGLSAVCGTGGFLSCGVVQLKQYSEWFGIPTPAFSLVFYGLVWTLARAALRHGRAELTRPLVYLFLLSVVALLTTLWMGFIAFVLLRTFCPFCFVLYLVSIGFAWAAFINLSAYGQPWLHLVLYDARRAHRSQPIWVLLAVSAAVLGAAGIANHRKPTVAPEARAIADPARRILGEPSAPVTLVVFSDFQCPYCRLGGEVIHALEAEMRGRVKVAYKFFPLDRACNPAGGSHALSCLAARAALCAGVEGRFWPFHDAVYAEQRNLTETSFVRFAASLGLDMGRFQACQDDPAAAAEVRADIDEAIRLGVRGTPSFFIDGRQYSGPLTVSALREAIGP